MKNLPNPPLTKGKLRFARVGSNPPFSNETIYLAQVGLSVVNFFELVLHIKTISKNLLILVNHY